MRRKYCILYEKYLFLNKDLSVEVLGQEGQNGTPFSQVYDINIDDEII